MPEILKSSPPTHCEGLMRVIAKCRGLKIENIIVGGGFSDLMFAFFPNMIKKGEKVLILDPMYGEYAHIFKNVIVANLIRHRLTAVNDFCINIKLLLHDILKYRPKMVVLVNPNSPTGKIIKKSDLLNLIKSIPKNIVVVIDETYIEYVGTLQSLEKEVARRGNLVIIKSMSKVYALSGARVGYIVAHSNILNRISQFIPPWSVSLIGQIAGVEALNDPIYYRKKYQETDNLREKMVAELKNIHSIKVYNSIANFFLIELLGKGLKADEIVLKLRKQKIYLRDCTSMSTQFNNDFIRIAVKDEQTNKIIVNALKEVL